MNVICTTGLSTETAEGEGLVGLLFSGAPDGAQMQGK